jgi:hypothetical protein
MANTKVTDAGLTHLEEMSSLEELNLYGTGVSQKAVASLKRMKSLQVLKLPVAIDDAGLEQLKDLRALRVLSVYGMGITDAGLVHLRDRAALEELDLSHTSISDIGLIHLKELKKLEVLNLSYTNITEAGLAHLKSLKNLRVLNIHSVGPDGRGIRSVMPGVISLWRALPGCHIIGLRPAPEIERALKREEFKAMTIFFICLSPTIFLLLYFLGVSIKRSAGV